MMMNGQKKPSVTVALVDGITNNPTGCMPQARYTVAACEAMLSILGLTEMDETEATQVVNLLERHYTDPDSGCQKDLKDYLFDTMVKIARREGDFFPAELVLVDGITNNPTGTLREELFDATQQLALLDALCICDFDEEASSRISWQLIKSVRQQADSSVRRAIGRAIGIHCQEQGQADQIATWTYPGTGANEAYDGMVETMARRQAPSLSIPPRAFGELPQFAK